MKACPLLKNLDDAEFAALLEIANPAVFITGQAIVRQGEKGDSIYIMLEGTADVILRREGQDNTRVSHLSAGEVFGELALAGRQARSADVIASSVCKVISISVVLLNELAAKSPGAAFKITMTTLEIVGERLRAANRKYIDSLAIVSVLATDSTIRVPQTPALFAMSA